jgi:hypothetical protein
MNNKEQHFSDEFLNAFVDDQLATEEKGRVYLEIGRDETLNRQVCELRRLHDLVQLAYREPPAPPARATSGLTSRHARLRFGVAASVLLTFGIVLGSQIRMPAPAPAPSLTAVPASATQKVANTAPPAKSAAKVEIANPVVARNEIPDNTTSKVLIHLARDDADQLSQALDDIESLLEHYRETRQSARVEVVVNGKGLELVRTDTSAFAGRIQRLLRNYGNLTFAACQNTIDRLAREQGVSVRLLPGVITIDSGMAEITRRQNQGWTYLQV